MVCCTTCNDEDFIESCYIVSSPVQFLKVYSFTIFGDVCTKCIANCFRLVMNFFQHEVFITAFFSSLCIPTYVEYFFINWITFTVKYGYSIASNDSHFTIAQDVSITCVINDCWNIGCYKVFTFTKTDNQWIFFFSTNNFIWLISTDDFKSIRTVNTSEHASYSTYEITIVHIL